MTLDEAIKLYTSNAEHERIHGSLQGCLDFKQLAEWLTELKQLREQTRWIPVSEKLPNDREWYLGIFKEPDTGWINPLPFICDYVGSETKATTKDYWILRGFTDRDEHIDYYFNLECVAWMPLPSSYERGEERMTREEAIVIPIPEEATNRDVIKIMYPNVIISESEDTVHLKYPTVNSDPLFFVQVSKKWWNAPYKEESEE